MITLEFFKIEDVIDSHIPHPKLIDKKFNK